MNSVNIPDKLRLLNSNSEVALELIDFIKERKFSKIALITTTTPNYLITNELEIDLYKYLETCSMPLLKTFQVITPSVSYVNQLQLSDFDLIIGIGGGKVIDTAKYAAHINNIPCVSIPTSISNDGICSPIAVLKEKQNKHVSLGATMPVALLVPLHLIEKSGEESLISGTGDLLSNLSAIEDWKLANKETNEYIDDYAVMISENAALNLFTQVKNYILQNKSRDQFLKDNLKMIIESIALSGIAMEISGTSRPASGAEHLISHSIDELFGGLKPHGIQVAFGMYITTFLRSELGYIPENTFQELRAVLRYLSLPTTLAAIRITKEQLVKAIIHAPQTRAGRYTILNKIKLEEKYIEEILNELFEERLGLNITQIF
ncbi:MAG: hypothetical protein A3I68_09040 [Candidatus Melainabacteria bacterium RIFCSPLOWO2_02_FULL_35_15]|nr:MAG: hypothetical protein A3I68_09040 [Candidatus Melainabacteria bacterium RIFCSPLOWO2_02_FULL_35_15]